MLTLSYSTQQRVTSKLSATRTTQKVAKVANTSTGAADGIEGGLEESRNNAHPQELVFQFSCEQLLPSLLCHNLISASPTPSLLLAVSAPVVRLVTASTHPSHQPISHQLCGVLVPTMAEKEKEEEEIAVGGKKQEAEKEKEEEEVAVGEKKQEGIREHQLKMLREALLCVLRDLLPHSHIDGLSVVEDGTISLALGSDSCPVVRYQLLPCIAGYGGECDRSFPSLAVCSRVWGKSSLSFTVFMDALAMACYGIPDVRLLWSRDKNIISQFRCRNASADIHYQSVSLFPPQYAHDISFWSECGADAVAETESRVDLELSQAAWAVAGSRLARVTRLETYFPPCEGGREGGEGRRVGGGVVREERGECGGEGRRVERGVVREERGECGGEGRRVGGGVVREERGECGGEGRRVGGGVVREERGEGGGRGGRRVGLCYRVEYSSCDSALARSTASYLQLRLRSAMATVDGLELR